MRGLQSLPIFARVGILGALVAITLISLAATLWYSDNATTHALARQKNFTDIERLSLEMEVGALQMRRREKDFLLRNEARYLDLYQTDADLVAERLAGLRQLDTPDEITEALGRLETNLPQHRQVFADVVAEQTVLGLTHEEGLQGALRSSVRDVEGRLADFNDADLTVIMLMMRRHEKDFMLRGTPRYIASFDARQTEFDELLAQRDYPATDVAAIRGLMQAYNRDFHAWAEGQLALNETIGQLSDIFADMSPDFDQILEIAQIEGRAAVASLEAERNRIRMITLGLVVAIAAIAGLLCWWVGRSIAAPIKALTDAMGELADGKTDGQVPAQRQGGEIGQMASAVLIFQKNQIEIDRMRAEQAEADARAADEKRRILNEMADEFDASVGSIAQDVTTASSAMIQVAGRLRDVAQQSDERSSIVASAAEETSANTQAVASAAEELTSSIQEINRQVTESRTLTSDAVQEADVTRTTVSGLGAAVVRIGDVVTLIQSIAEQTNLLALNATIEASRAGDAGKGFAVVASEVKALADQTAKATLEIADQIESIQKSGDHAITAIGSMVTTIDRVSQSTTAIASAIEQQDAAAREIAGSVSQAAAGTSQVTESIAALSSNVRDTDSGAGEVLTAAQGVSSDAERLKDALASFLDQIRAA
ncbi:methyl-accepting chemotaxis protein [uncultured Maricaulis sp.]|uniref:methyl-accepting chemotaxis protein n=1 Tax=uncultured Maricaulis sp. TaxID=174710 RepID=UPI00260A74BC|nr:methyl-accepting chemotaxis protein [uncultured Maricaulis sp.]